MRETASLASSYGRRQLPASLMQRLALMQHFALLAQAQANGRTPRILHGPRRPRPWAQVIVLAWFSLGVVASGAVGVGTLVGMRAMAAGGTPPMVWTRWARTPRAASTAQPDAAWDAIRVEIDRGARAPFPLQVTGAGDAGFEVVMQGLPAGVRPSRGEPRGDATWVLGPADLDDLQLVLDAAAPETFDIRIAVAASPGVAAAGSIVQVRLVGAAARKQAAARGDPGTAPQPPADPGMPGEPATHFAEPAPPNPPHPARTSVAGGDKPAMSPGRRRAASPARPATQTGAGRSWPEGASGLGATPRKPEGPSWWKMPPPSWSPFLIGQERP